jgi:hypothetical protein
MRNGKILDLRFDQGQIGQGNAVMALSRASSDTIFDAALIFQELPNAIPAITHDPVASASRGLQVPRSTVNEARNNRAAGATNGVIGSGGVAPTDWIISAGVSGLSREIVGTGTEDGLLYCDIRFFGTASPATLAVLQTLATEVPAVEDEVWTHSGYSRLVGGDLTNVSTVRIEVQDRDSGGSQIGGSSTIFTPTSAALKTQRRDHTRTLGASTAYVRQSYSFVVTNGAVDFTIRFAGTHLEEAPFATPLVLTAAGGSSARANTNATIDLTGVPGWVDGGPVTIRAEFEQYANVETGFPRVFSIHDGTAVNRIVVLNVASADQINAEVISDSVSQLTGASFGSYTGGPAVVALALAENNMNFAKDGVVGTPDTSGTIPTGLTTIKLGGAAAVTAPFEGYLRRFTVWAGALHADLGRITT